MDKKWDKKFHVEEFRYKKRDKVYVTIEELRKYTEKNEVTPFDRIVIVGEDRISIFENREKYMTAGRVKDELKDKNIKRGDIICVIETDKQREERKKDEAIEMEEFEKDYEKSEEY